MHVRPDRASIGMAREMPVALTDLVD